MICVSLHAGLFFTASVKCMNKYSTVSSCEHKVHCGMMTEEEAAQRLLSLLCFQVSFMTSQTKADQEAQGSDQKKTVKLQTSTDCSLNRKCLSQNVISAHDWSTQTSKRSREMIADTEPSRTRREAETLHVGAALDYECSSNIYTSTKNKTS